LQYRPEIDGLRAIAVVPVILFHAGFSLFSGGYVGVDVFFVISGFLITSIILKDLDRDKFSLLNFYERRARRILPALFFVVIACIPFAWLFFTPEDYKNFSQSLGAVVVFLSNVLFWQEGGYFQAASELKPLLHTWSLAIEEQYYVIFPLFLILFRKSPRILTLGLLSAAFVVSLGLSQQMLLTNSGASFYLLPTRGWELLIGAFAAFYVQRQNSAFSMVFNQFASLLGLSLILISVFAFNNFTPFPGFFALIPTIGTVLVILFAKENTWVNRMLSVKVMVGIGLISYSAYLWHQPLLAFTHYHSFLEPSVLVTLLLITMTFVLAYLSWRFVEKPFRYSEKVSRKQVFAFSIIGGAAIFTIGVLGHLRVIQPYDYLKNPQYYAVYEIDRADAKPCESFPAGQGHVGCIEFGEGESLTVLWGDSHAESIRYGISKELTQKEGRIMTIFHRGCPPLIDVVNLNGVTSEPNCVNLDDLRRYAMYIKEQSPNRIVLVSRWTTYLRGWHIKDEPQMASHFISTTLKPAMTAEDSRNAVMAQLKNTLSFFDGTPVYALGQVPDMQHLTLRQRRDLEVVDGDKIKAWHNIENELMEAVGISSRYIDMRSELCSSDSCKLRDEGYKIYFDDNHVSAYGAMRQLDRIFEDVKTP